MINRLVLRRSLMATLLAISSAIAQAPLDVRMALVIGNSAYDQSPLRNPVNDARAMGDTLRSLGFQVVELRDGSRQQMVEAIAAMRKSLAGKQAVGMLYFAGHGLQLDWHNYMIPVDAVLSMAEDVPKQAVDMSTLLEAFKQAGNRMNIVVLDACRNNPFSNFASNKGLAQMDAMPGTLLAYATSPGNVASDGDDTSQNGLYTKFLLQELKQPTAKIEDVFKRVRVQVRQSSAGEQIPWESTSLEEDFYFDKTVRPARPDVTDRIARFNLEKTDWDRVKDSKVAADIYTFVKKYPNGAISELAQAKLERLEKARVQVQPDQTGAVQASIARRFRVGDEYQVVVSDIHTGAVTDSPTFKVVKADEDTAEFNQGYKVTQAGAIIRTIAGATLDPYQQWIPSGDYQVGKRWTSRSNMTLKDGTTVWVEMDGKVVARETVTVPAGRFDVYKMEMLQTAQDGTRLKVTYWGQPDWGVAIKQIRELTDKKGKTSGQVYELVKRTRSCQNKPAMGRNAAVIEVDICASQSPALVSSGSAAVPTASLKS